MNKEPIAVRVARRFQADLDDKMKALLLKLRKGADASLSMKQLTMVLNYLGGWRVEPFVGLVQMHGYGGAEADRPSQEADEHPGTVQRLHELAKRDEVPSLPTNPQPGQRYTMDVTEPTAEGWRTGLTGFLYKAWQGAKGIRFTSPEGKVFELLPDKYDLERRQDAAKLPLWDVLKWLKKETTYYEQISNALGMPTHEKEREEAKPRTRENTGTCPACFRNIKLKARSGNQHPGIVLHGYRRPGWGQVHGSCFGVNYPPFELSPEGTKDLIGNLEKIKKNEEDFLKRLKAGEVTELYDSKGRKSTLETEGAFYWEQRIKSKITAVERLAKSLESDIDLLGKLVSEWKEQPLPTGGVKIKPPPPFLR